jgi:DNA-binding transcriptional LysR family regulator
MSQFDHLDLDGHLLQLLVAVQEEQSVTRAALRLGVTQSAVSHGLDKLRSITGDALFIRSGRGITPTSSAELMCERARELLNGLQGFCTAAGFDPARIQQRYTIAANDLQRDLLLPPLLRQLCSQAPGLSFRIISSGAPGPQMLREGPCQLIITPRPPDAADILQQRLFEDRYALYYDPAQRQPPSDLNQYLEADHVSVTYDPGRKLDIDEWMIGQGVQRRMVATVPGFAAMGALLRGSRWIATAPSRLAQLSLHALATAPVPVRTPIMPMYMVWHQRTQDDPVQAWIRRELLQLTQQLVTPLQD